MTFKCRYERISSIDYNTKHSKLRESPAGVGPRTRVELANDSRRQLTDERMFRISGPGYVDRVELLHRLGTMPTSSPSRWRMTHDLVAVECRLNVNVISNLLSAAYKLTLQRPFTCVVGNTHELKTV